MKGIACKSASFAYQHTYQHHIIYCDLADLAFDYQSSAVSWSLMVNAQFRFPSTPYISSLLVSLTGPTLTLSSVLPSTSPKFPGWKDHVVGTPNLSGLGRGEDLLHLAPKHLLLCPSLSICECTSEMCSEDTRRQCKVYLSIEHRLSEYFGLGLQTLTCVAPFQGTQQDLQRRRRGGRRSCRRPVLYTDLPTPPVACDSLTEAWNL